MPLELRTPELSATLDPARGADILALVDARTGTDVLFRTPWRARADAAGAGQRSGVSWDPTAAWLEQYRGGWQTLCPVAGPPRTVHGAPVGFHGEASTVPWSLERSEADSARLSVELFSVPVRIDRTVSLDGPRARVDDVLVNLSDVELELDFSHHPALGGALLAGDCIIETGARRFTPDPDRCGTRPASPWPAGIDTSGAEVDLEHVPATATREVFGWLHDFTDHWATVVSPGLGLGVNLAWDGSRLPYAWLWQELNATDGFPWFRRARALAIEPASAPTSGPERRSAMRLSPQERVEVSLAVTFEDRSS